MPIVGQICATVGSISQAEANDIVYRADDALSKISAPSTANDVFGFMAGLFNSLTGSVLSFCSSVLGFGANIVTSDLESLKDFYVGILQAYAGDSSLIGVQVKQRYIYRRCQTVEGWYVYGAPIITAYHYPGGWEPIN